MAARDERRVGVLMGDRSRSKAICKRDSSCESGVNSNCKVGTGGEYNMS